MKIVFAGSPQFAADALVEIANHHDVAMVLTMPDSPVGRKRVLTPTPVATAANELGLEVRKLRGFSHELIEELAQSDVEAGVVIAFGVLVPQKALQLFSWINLHYSLLPMWRGASPLQQSILHGTGQGFTIFELDEGMDTGPVLSSKELSYPPDKTSGELLPYVTELGTQALLKVLDGDLSRAVQVGEPTLAPKLKRTDARVRFQESADQIHRKVMAFNPEPMAWCELGDEPLRILRSRSLGATDWNGLGGSDLLPGQLEVCQGRVLVGCGAGTRLELLQVQPAGKKPMGALDWYRGQSPEVRLG